MFFLNVIGHRKESLLSFLNLFNDAIKNSDPIPPIMLLLLNNEFEGVWNEASLPNLMKGPGSRLEGLRELWKPLLSAVSLFDNCYRSAEPSCLGIRD
jgi:hypothetical protein